MMRRTIESKAKGSYTYISMAKRTHLLKTHSMVLISTFANPLPINSSFSFWMIYYHTCHECKNWNLWVLTQCNNFLVLPPPPPMHAHWRDKPWLDILETTYLFPSVPQARTGHRKMGTIPEQSLLFTTKSTEQSAMSPWITPLKVLDTTRHYQFLCLSGLWKYKINDPGAVRLLHRPAQRKLAFMKFW
jgi:hypothetical protein